MSKVRYRAMATLGLVLSGVLVLSACSGPTSTSTSSSTNKAAAKTAKQITVWTTDDQPSRLAADKANYAGFTNATGIKVNTVAVSEDQFNQQLVSAAAANKLPDVVAGMSPTMMGSLDVNHASNSAAMQAVVDKLGSSTFNKRAIELSSSKGKLLGVPAYGWLQFIYYRKDLLKKQGLPEPNTYQNLLSDAKALTTKGRAGIVAATGAGDAFTEQTFEEIALANNCQLVNSAGDITFDSKQCVGALSFYKNLITEASVPGKQDVQTTQANYLAGKAAMVIWSTYLLPSLTGSKPGTKPACTECQSNPAYLAENSGVVPALLGPDGKTPAQFAQVVSWGITKTANAPAAEQFIEYMLTTGYKTDMAQGPEGRFPAHSGTQSEPTKYSDIWATLPLGGLEGQTTSKVFGPDMVKAISNGLDATTRWAIAEGQTALLGAMAGPTPVANAVNAVVTGTATPAAAAQQAATKLRQLQSSIKANG